MDGDLVDGFLLICATGTLDGVLGSEHTSGFLLAVNEGRLLTIGRILEVEKEV